MPARSSSSSSSSTETEEITTGVLAGSGTSGNIGQTTASHRAASSTASQNSAVATGTPYDSVSIATTNTGFTSATNITANTSASQQQVLGGGIPIIRPPVLQSPQQPLGANIGAVNQPIQVDIASAHQQYGVQSEISPYSASSVTSSGGSSLQQQPRFDVAKAIFTQVDTNHDGSISREEFRHWAQAGNQTSGQFQYQQAQFANQLPGQQPFNQLLGADAFNDVVLNIDYGVIEAYNVGLQSAGDITAEQLSGPFDVAKAIFKQVDTNQDGSISRDEFRQWAQNGNQPNVGGQSYSNNQATSTNYGNSFHQGQSVGNTNPEIANILQQSGLAQGYANY